MQCILVTTYLSTKKARKGQIRQMRQGLTSAASQAKAWNFSLEPSKVLPRALEVYRGLVERLESVEDVSGAREALKEFFGWEILTVSKDGIRTPK